MQIPDVATYDVDCLMLVIDYSPITLLNILKHMSLLPKQCRW